MNWIQENPLERQFIDESSDLIYEIQVRNFRIDEETIAKLRNFLKESLKALAMPNNYTILLMEFLRRVMDEKYNFEEYHYESCE